MYFKHTSLALAHQHAISFYHKSTHSLDIKDSNVIILTYYWSLFLSDSDSRLTADEAGTAAVTAVTLTDRENIDLLASHQVAI